jgi:hypothetical protein
MSIHTCYRSSEHILKNYAMALLKIYGPPGLFELVSLLHNGRTENYVLNCSDFDQTFAFFYKPGKLCIDLK